MMRTRSAAFARAGLGWVGVGWTGPLGWAGLLAATISLSLVAAFTERVPGDRAVTGWIQDLDSAGLDTLSDVLFSLGLWPAFLIVGLLMSSACWYARQRLAAAFALLALVSGATSILLKAIIERPRPSEELVRVVGDPGGFSFPSGHVLGTVLLWGFVLYVTPQVIANRRLALAVRAFALLVLLLMGLQRVYAGAHWPSDAVGGYLWGGLLLAAIIRAFEYFQDRAGLEEQRRADA